MVIMSKNVRETTRIATRKNLQPTEGKATSNSPPPVLPEEQLVEKTASLENMFAEISKMSITLQGVAADILTIKETTN